MNKVCDPIMDEVYAVRHELSAASGHDPGAYFVLVQNEKREANNRGMSYFEYCLSKLNHESAVAQTR